ncbi:MAG: hypothetical protein ACLTSX_13090 [Collinsella sp.]
MSKHVIAQQADPKFLATQLIDLATTSAASAEALAKLPTQLSNTLEMLDRGQIKVNGDIEVSSRILATAYASVGRISLALLSAGLFLGSSILCTTAHAAATARRAPARRAGLCRRLRAGCLHGVPHPGLPPSPSQQRGAAVGVCNVVSTGGRRRETENDRGKMAVVH